MRSTRLLALVDVDDPAAAFDRIADFGAFPALADDVRTVTVQPRPDGRRESEWSVNFRRGIMRWTETETFDRPALRIDFHQVAGDFAEFSGYWLLRAVRGRTEVRFEVDYDFGIDSLAGIMDPIAERVITRVICSVLTGLFGEITLLDGGAALTDLAATTTRGAC